MPAFLTAAETPAAPAVSGGEAVTAPMPGTALKVTVAQGQTVLINYLFSDSPGKERQ